MAKYLDKRGDYYYAQMGIPKRLHLHYGKKKHRQALGTTSRQQANILVLTVVAEWKQEHERLIRIQDHGMTPDMIQEDIRREYESIPDHYPFQDDDGKTHWIEVDRKGELAEYVGFHYVDDAANPDEVDQLKEMTKVATGELIRLADFVDGWLAEWTAAAKTKDMGRKAVTDFIKVFPHEHKVTRPKVKKYFKDLDISNATKQRMLSSIRGFWDHINDELEIEEPRQPFTRIVDTSKKTKASRSESKDRSAFTVDEVAKLHGAAKGQDLKDLIALAAYSGMRIEECCSHMCVDGDWFVITNAKTEAGNRRIPIHPELLNGTLERWLDARSKLSENKYGDLSNAIGKRFGRLKATLGFGPDYTFHSIRHTVATEMKRADPSLSLVISELLGHNKPNDQTFGRYAKEVDDHKRELIEALSYDFG